MKTQNIFSNAIKKIKCYKENKMAIAGEGCWYL